MSSLTLPFRVNQSFVSRKLRSVRHGIFQCRNLRSSCVVLDDSDQSGPKGSDSDANEKLKNLLKTVKLGGQSSSSEEKYQFRALPVQKLDKVSIPQEKKAKEAKQKIGKPKAKPLIIPVDSPASVDPDLICAAETVAKDQARGQNDKDVQYKITQRTKSDLLKKLQAMAEETNDARVSNDISKANVMQGIFQNLKIEKLDQAQNALALNRRALSAEEKAFLEKRKKLRSSQNENNENEKGSFKSLYASEEPLGIFNKDLKSEDKLPSLNPTWDKCLDRELKILSQHSPRNFLEEMASWTDNGILWHFPINNEQGIDEATMEPFYKHVFLEPYLEPWCPQRGPLRHFMELVVVGLSKNPHITVEKKIEHINWFRDYFNQDDHKEILKLSGALDM